MKNKTQRKTSKIGAALVTGGAKRIGREIALFLAQNGFDIAISYNKSQADAQKLAEEITKKFAVKCEIFAADLCREKDARSLIDAVIERFTHLNLLINNASIFNKSKFFAASENELSDNLNIHFIAPLILSQQFAKNVLMRDIKNAQIINMIDKNIVRFDTQYFCYLLSKKNLAEATKMLALELAPHVRVNGIAPGFILNPIDGGVEEEKLQNIIKKIPLQRKGEPQNIVQTVEFLIKNDFINGQIIAVDGGASLNHAG